MKTFFITLIIVLVGTAAFAKPAKIAEKVYRVDSSLVFSNMNGHRLGQPNFSVTTGTTSQFMNGNQVIVESMGENATLSFYNPALKKIGSIEMRDLGSKGILAGPLVLENSVAVFVAFLRSGDRGFVFVDDKGSIIATLDQIDRLFGNSDYLWDNEYLKLSTGRVDFSKTYDGLFKSQTEAVVSAFQQTAHTLPAVLAEYFTQINRLIDRDARKQALITTIQIVTNRIGELSNFGPINFFFQTKNQIILPFYLLDEENNIPECIYKTDSKTTCDVWTKLQDPNSNFTRLKNFDSTYLLTIQKKLNLLIDLSTEKATSYGTRK